MASTTAPDSRTVLDLAKLRQVGFWALISGLAIAAVVFFAASLAWVDRPYPGFKIRIDRAVELQLPPSSTGARAGLRPGDRLLSLDGVALRDPRALYAEVASKPIGTPIRYTFERDLPDGARERLTRIIATQRHGWWLWATIFLPLWLTGLCFLALGATVSVLKPGDPRARANLAFHLAGAAACFSVFDQSTTFLSPFQDPCKLLQWAIAICFTNFALQFPRRHARLEWAQRANWMLGLLLGFALLAANAAERFTFWVHFAHLPYIAVGEIVLLANALWSVAGPNSTPEERGQGRVILLGTLLSTVPALLVPQAHSLGVPINLEGLENFALPLWPLAISYAVVRYNLFDLRPLVRRSLSYVLAAVLLTLLYAGASAGLGAMIGRHTPLPGVGATVLVVVAFAPLRDRLKRWLDARFFRAPYRFAEVLAAFTRTAQDSADPRVLVQAYRAALAGALAPTRLALLLDSNAPAGLDGDAAERPELSRLLETGASWHGEPVRVLPLAVQGRVLGHVFVGPKKSGLPYTALDAALLDELTQSLAVWLNLFERFEQAQTQTREIEALRRSEAMQGQFLNMVSHELKIPLAVMVSSLNLLVRAEEALDAKTVTHLPRLRRSLTHLSALVGDLLNAGQLQSGHFQLHPRAVDLTAVASDTVAEMRPLAEQKAQTLTLASAPLPTLHADGARLEQVLRNLLHNAIRYTPSGGHIQLSLLPSGDGVRCEVRDDGPGIPPEALPRLFQRFSQVKQDAPEQSQGVGLGLFIARAIVEAHGGRIGVESTPRAGSTFWFTLPASAATAPC